ncbi:MAG TPA: SGNH/GDSL hydrolase family protein [Clostridiales bacterium]|nr:SGNH/GDSL hydrolase family protein [Clostridiales bacterium]
MRRTFCKLTGILLSLCLLCSVLTVFAGAAEAETMHYKNYTIVGDSIASGYGTDNYFDGNTERIEDERVVAGTYADLVSKGVQAENTVSVAHSGWRTTEILRVLKDDYTLEDETRVLQDSNEFYMRALNMLDWDLFFYKENDQWVKDKNGMYEVKPSLKAHIRKSIAAADLLTVQFGSNDIYSTALSTTFNKYANLLEKTGVFDFDFKNIQGQEDLEKAFAVLLEVAKVSGQFSMVLADYFTELENGFTVYKNNMPLVLEELRKLNPDADILFVGVANPTSITGDLPLKIWDYSEIYAARINNWTDRFCQQNGVLFARCDTLDYYGIAALDWEKLFALDGDVKYSAVKMMHPTELGHQQMAEEILGVLQEHWEQKKQAAIAEIKKDTKEVLHEELLASLQQLIG